MLLGTGVLFTNKTKYLLSIGKVNFERIFEIINYVY